MFDSIIVLGRIKSKISRLSAKDERQNNSIGKMIKYGLSS